MFVIIFLVLIGNKVIYKNDFAVVTGTISLSNGEGTTTLNYPSGFDATNCVAIATGIDIFATNYFTYNCANTMSFSTRFTASNINVVVKNSDSSGTTATKNVQVILMKI